MLDQLAYLGEVRGRFVTPALKVVLPAADAELAAVPGVAAVRQGDGGRIVELAAGAAAPAVIRALAVALPLEAVAPLAETLEDIFLRAVGRPLRPPAWSGRRRAPLPRAGQETTTQPPVPRAEARAYKDGVKGASTE